MRFDTWIDLYTVLIYQSCKIPIKIGKINNSIWKIL